MRRFARGTSTHTSINDLFTGVIGKIKFSDEKRPVFFLFFLRKISGLTKRKVEACAGIRRRESRTNRRRTKGKTNALEQI